MAQLEARNWADPEDHWTALDLGHPEGLFLRGLPSVVRSLPHFMLPGGFKTSNIPDYLRPSKSDLQCVLSFKLETDPVFTGKLHCIMGTWSPQRQVQTLMHGLPPFHWFLLIRSQYEPMVSPSTLLEKPEYMETSYASSSLSGPPSYLIGHRVIYLVINSTNIYWVLGMGKAPHCVLYKSSGQNKHGFYHWWGDTHETTQHTN